MCQQLYKRYVNVEAIFTKFGDIKPIAIYLENGERYEIDKILTIKPKISKVGGGGIQYVCRIQNHERNLFLEQNQRWFIESYKP